MFVNMAALNLIGHDSDLSLSYYLHRLHLRILNLSLHLCRTEFNF